MSAGRSSAHVVPSPSSVHCLFPFLQRSESGPSQASPRSGKSSSMSPSQSSSRPLQASSRFASGSSSQKVAVPSAAHFLTPFGQRSASEPSQAWPRSKKPSSV